MGPRSKTTIVLLVWCCLFWMSAADEEVLFTHVNSNTLTNVGFWTTECAKIPSDADHLKMVIGNVVDFFKPIKGETMCTMLLNNNKHMWSSDGVTWTQPGYQDERHMGSSEPGWVKDGRVVVINWGWDSTDTDPKGACCSTEYDDKVVWNQELDAYYIRKTEKTVFLTHISSTQTANAVFLNSLCAQIPENALYFTMIMGKVVDYYKPRAGVSMCAMLQSFDKHMWSSDGITWVQPAYVAGGSIGGSSAGWPKDGRTYLQFWGSPGHTGGCCDIDYDKTSGWKTALDIYYVINVDKELWASRGAGRCPDLEQRGSRVVSSTTGSCLERCEPISESYFSISEEDGKQMCTCYQDCDSLAVDAGTETFEILSKTMQEKIFDKDEELIKAHDDILETKSQAQLTKLDLGECNKALTEKTTALATCESNHQTKSDALVESEKQTLLWKNRFEEVVRLETSDPLSGKSLEKYPDTKKAEVKVGANTASNNCESNNLLRYALFTMLGAGTGFGLCLFCRKDFGDMYDSLL